MLEAEPVSLDEKGDPLRGLALTHDPGPGSAPPPPSSPKELRGEVTRADFEELYRTHVGYTYWLALKLLKDPDEAQDCCQEVWIKVRRNLESFEGRASFKSWLARVATNHAKDQIRKRDKLRRSLQASIEIWRYETQRRKDPSLELHGELLKAVDSLEDLQRDVIEARLEDPKITLEEIAQRLGHPRHKIKYEWKKALAALAARLKEWGAIEEYLQAWWIPIWTLAQGVLRG